MTHLYQLPLDLHRGEVVFTIVPTVIQWEQELILVDCGYRGFLPQIQQGMAKLGLDMADVRKIFITHHDHDHMGALQEILAAYPDIQVLCSSQQAPFVTGQSKSLRLIQAEKLQDSLPEQEKEGGLAFQAEIAAVKPVDRVTIVAPEDTFCGGDLVVVDTTGHMPGHISLYVPSQKALISGDALVANQGKLCMAMPQFLLNREEAEESVRNLQSLDIEKIYCYHGGLCENHVQDSLRDIIQAFDEP